MHLRAILFLVPLIFCGPASAQEECSTVAECAQEAVEAAFQAKLALQIAVPKGAVMAFLLDECPEGWNDLSNSAGRFLRGKDKNEVGTTGGQNQFTITEDNLPAVLTDVTNDKRMHGTSKGGTWVPLVEMKKTTTNGKNVAIPTVPKFLVVKYCVRQ